jgi:molybdopterin converting factor small subunit
MPTVWIPKPMQVHTRGQEIVQCEGRNVRRLIVNLDEAYPGLKDALMDDDKLKPSVAIAVDGQITQLGLLQPLTENNEVFFVPPISGG